MAQNRTAVPPAGDVRMNSACGKWILLATVMGSGVVALDATVVNVALPSIAEEFNTGVSGLQWILSSYLLTLASLILLGGALGDRYGRRKIFIIGVIWFSIASLFCGLSTNINQLIAARALQGVGGALLTPGSLALIQASFHPDERGRAVGAWSGLGGIAMATGPLVGGWIVDTTSWRLIFLVNIPLSILTVWVAATKVPESIDPTAQHQRLDVPGATLVAVGLAGTTYALIQSPEQGFTSSQVLIPGLVGIIALIAFVVVEQQSTHPMLPLDLFKSRQFTGANLVTVSIYAALGGFFFLLIVHLQVTLGYSALQAGAATIPMTFMMLFLSAKAGAVADKIGPRLPMTVGPLTISVAMLLMTRIDEGADYLTVVLPAVLVFGLGLAMTVAPLTAAVLGAADQRHAGIASGVNNAVARVAQLTAIAVLPGLAGISGSDFSDAAALSDGFSQAALITAGLAALGGLIAFVSIRRPLNAYDDEIQHDALHCCLDGPPLRSTAPQRIESLQ